MKPLFVLLGAFVVAAVIIRLAGQAFQFALSARIALSVMLVFTAIAHFAFTKGMAMMMPDFIPFKKVMVYLTGAAEIAGAIGIELAQFKTLASWLLILFFIAILPANINAAIRKIDYQKGTYDGSGLNYLWFRVPLQVLFIAWVYVSSIQH
ncbi:MAG: hypothetical protein ACLP05_00230 [Candidatus Kryptoniota bacterium]